MKALVCEMCGSQELVKQDGMYVCQNCGTKYDPEEAKKLMIEVSGKVEIDRSKELENLFKAARNARSVSDSSSAISMYEKIIALQPDSWEATFYLVILKTYSLKNGEIQNAAISVSNCLRKVFQLIKSGIQFEEEKRIAVKEVVDECYNTAVRLTNASHSFYSMVTRGNGMMALTGVSGALSGLASTGNAIDEDKTRCSDIANIMCYCGNYIEEIFGMSDRYYKEYAILSWKKMLQLAQEFEKFHGTDLFSRESLNKFSSKVHSYDQSYEVIKKKKPLKLSEKIIIGIVVGLFLFILIAMLKSY